MNEKAAIPAALVKFALVAKSVNAAALEAAVPGGTCRFDSDLGH